MPVPFELLVEKRPVSLQTRNRANLQSWKAYVGNLARTAWGNGPPLPDGPLRLCLVYLCDDAPADIDNIIKPIQDALVGVVYEDDSLVSDVDSHRRFLSDPIAVAELPPLLSGGVVKGQECVYLFVTDALDLRAYL